MLGLCGWSVHFLGFRLDTIFWFCHVHPDMDSERVTWFLGGTDVGSRASNVQAGWEKFCYRNDDVD